ncbi:MAG: hypothetical protein FWB85_12050 [Chitinispirillia bacterium]|nr:hypothetical protein [Chitinispirillia bacterium]MCL2242806.1 hypothetical protein [Chitinispirillia bacterium]
MNRITKHPVKTSRGPRAGIIIAIFSVAALIFISCTSRSDDSAAGKAGAENTGISCPAPVTADGSTPPAPAAQVTQGPVIPPRLPAAPAAADSLYDLYIMSMCPFGYIGLANIMDLARAFPQRKWNVWFIGRVEGDKLTSMRGEPEVFDEKLWLGVQALYPARYQDFLTKRGTPGTPTEDLLKEMGLDVKRIRKWAEDMGHDELRKHYTRSQGLGVAASPTLYINERQYQGAVGRRGQIVREKCNAADPKPQFCNDYPECADDNDCFMAGKIGSCSKPPKGRAACEFRDDVPFTLTVLVADSAIDNPEAQAIQMLRGMLPGAKVNILKLSSDEGRKFMEMHNPPALPFIHFEKAVENAHRFAQVQARPGIYPAPAGGYQLVRGGVRENYFPKRAEKPGMIELYIDPMMPEVEKVLNTVLSNPGFSARVTIRPAALKNPREPAALDKMRLEEALRWIVLAGEFPKSYQQYLNQYAIMPASTYWFDWLKDLKIDQKTFLRRVEANQSKMPPYLEDFTVISAGEPVMLIIGNRAKAGIPNEQELERVLKLIIDK